MFRFPREEKTSPNYQIDHYHEQRVWAGRNIHTRVRTSSNDWFPRFSSITYVTTITIIARTAVDDIIEEKEKKEKERKRKERRRRSAS
ncbi:unnamed protein product [Adineta ricciae]|uniref:Uncharacterized protein n=1 Tax=Adineta ricciae TaxID=249248 RepID=A0A814SHY9_ADIRI|nr:unnamed protein product [Adineta ricciae]